MPNDRNEKTPLARTNEVLGKTILNRSEQRNYAMNNQIHNTRTNDGNYAMTNNLMQIDLAVQQMSSREIANVCGKDHSHVLRDIRSMIEQLDDPKMDHIDFKEVFDSRGYTAQILLSKDLTLVLVAGYSAKLRRAIIKRWQELETQASQPATPDVQLPDFTNPAVAARAWADEVEAKMIAIEQVNELAPKAAALETLSHAKGSLGIRETAKSVGIPERDFIARCLNKNKPVSSRFLFRDENGKLNAYAHRIKQGFMTQKITTYQGKDNKSFATVKVMFTPAGVAHVARLMQVKATNALKVV